MSVQAALTDYHRLAGFNGKHLFLTVLEAWIFKIKVPPDLGSADGLLVGRWPCFSLSPYMAECREEANSLLSLGKRALIPSWGWGFHLHHFI